MNFRALREASGFRTQTALARKAGIQKATISQIELGKISDPTYKTVKAIAEALGVKHEIVARIIDEQRKAVA